MKIIEAGHIYLLDSLDGGNAQNLIFVKRCGDNFPFNYNQHPGTNVQEVLRALINRTQYLSDQKPCMETEAALGNLKSALVHFESRAAIRHNRKLDFESISSLVNGLTCDKCKHIGCTGKCDH